MPKLNSCHNIAQLRSLAKQRLPAPMYHYIEGGADDEWSARRNTSAFDDWQLIPHCLRDVSNIEMSTTVLGEKIDLPVLLSPTGMSRLFHKDKEVGACRAAGSFNTFYSLSTMSTTSIEDVAAASKAPKMFQIYVLKDRGLTREFVARCKDSGYSALCLTVDTPLAGNRERDITHGMTIPPRVGFGSVFSYASSFRWLTQLLLDRDFRMANLLDRPEIAGEGTVGLIKFVNQQFDRSLDWSDAEWLAAEWNGPLAIKGIQAVSDVQQAHRIGATAAMISNHGGRQLDGTPAPVDCLQGIRDKLGDSMELILDGGVRRGTHVIKALALGASACSIGRPYLYGLAAGGQSGVEKALQILSSEIERSLALLGVAKIGDLGPQHIAKLGAL